MALAYLQQASQPIAKALLQIVSTPPKDRRFLELRIKQGPEKNVFVSRIVHAALNAGHRLAAKVER